LIPSGPISGTRSSASLSTAPCPTLGALSASPSRPAVPRMPPRHPVQSDGRLWAAAPPTSGGIPRRCERRRPGAIDLRWPPGAGRRPERLCHGGRCATDGWNQ
jgi:hypothetical protein